MTNFNYALKREDYDWTKALTWGNCIGHCKKATEGTLGNRLVHAIIAIAEALPIIGQIASLFETFIVRNFSVRSTSTSPSLEGRVSDKANAKEPTAPTQPTTARVTATGHSQPSNAMQTNGVTFDTVIQSTPAFNFYRINSKGNILTGLTVRPANLFFDAVFKGSGITTTQPQPKWDDYEHFAFNKPQTEVRKFLTEKATKNPNGIVAFSAKGKEARLYTNRNLYAEIDNLGTIFGDKTYQMNYKEIMATLDSQKIYTSPLLPVPFYRGLKKAMKDDGIVLLPGNDGDPITLNELKKKNDNVGAFLRQVESDWTKFGFPTKKDAFEMMLELTIYQVGAMIVKSEDYRIFIDGQGKMIAREPGKNDAIRLINACGIRGFGKPKTPQGFNKGIMTNTFKTALAAAEKGIVVFPAVGMGVWKGDPDLYWRAFLDAVVKSGDSFELICVNPGHQPTESGKYTNCKGDEFQTILDEYVTHHKDDQNAVNNLKKIKNLYDLKTDVVYLAHNLKQAFPDKIVSLFNASDPDVTLGNHVGEYTNRCPHTHTTEENYTAMGTNGLCFEGITGIHESEDRIIQVTNR